MRKIFNRLLIAMAAITINTAAFAQETAVQPPAAPQAQEVSTPKFDTEKFNKKMADLKVKMRQLQKQMTSKSFNANRDVALAFKDFDKNFGDSFKGFDKNFNESFKDFGKNFAGSFSEMAPAFAESFKNINGANFNNNNLNSDEYKQKLASGQMTERVKNYSKSYSVDANDVLQISNSFGKIVVNTWAKNEFKVDVQMKFSADDEDYVNNMINGSSISDSKVGSLISFRTNMANINGNHGNNHIEINYTVYMPAGNSIDVNNRFGNITLPDLSGNASIKVSYGSLFAQQLLGKENNVELRFASDNSSTITVFNGGRLKLSYSKLKVGVLNNVNSDISFSSISIDKLKNSADFRIKYGDGFTINNIDRSVRNLNINASFTNIKLDFKNAESFNFDVTTKMGGFDYNDDRIKVTAKTPSDEDKGWSSTKTYKGYIGKNNSDNKVTITGSFTEVKFY